MPLQRLVSAQRVAARGPGSASAHRHRRGMARSSAGCALPRAARLVALWASRRGPPRHRARRISGRDPGSHRQPAARGSWATRTRDSRISFRRPRACSVRCATSRACRSTDPDARPWLRHAAWPESYRPLVDTAAAAERRRAAPRPLPVRPCRGRRGARDRRRSGARRHHRAGALSLLGRGREGIEARRAPRVRAQGHRAALHAAADPRGASASRRASRATPLSPSRGRTARRSRAWPARRCPRALRGCARCTWSSSASPTTWAISARSATMRDLPSG